MKIDHRGMLAGSTLREERLAEKWLAKIRMICVHQWTIARSCATSQRSDDC